MDQFGTKSDTTEGLTKEAARGGGIAFAGLLAGQAIALGTNLVLTRVLGASLYGIYALGLSIVNANRAFITLGVAQAVVRYGAMYSGVEDQRRLKGTFALGLVFSLGVNSVLGVAIYFLADVLALQVFKEPDLAPVLKLLAISFPFLGVLRVAGSALRSLKRIDYDISLQQLLQPTLNLVLICTSFLLGYRLFGAVYAFLLSLGVSALFGVLLLIRVFPNLISSLSPVFNTRAFISFAVVLFLVGLSGNLLLQADRLVVGYFLPADQVGIYSIAATVTRKVAIVFGALGFIFEPMVSDLYHRRQIPQLENILKTTTGWTISLTLPICIVFALFSEEIMALFGSEFTGGVAAFSVLLLGQLVNAALGRLGTLLIMTGHQNTELANRLFTLVVFFVLSVILVPSYGILGAAIATTSAFALASLGRLLTSYYLFRMHPFKASNWKPVLAGLASIGFGLWVAMIPVPFYWLWMAQMVVIGIFYFAVLRILGFDQEDQIVLFALKKRIKSLI